MFVIWRSRALAILLCEIYTWTLTREWALSVHLAKMGTWALTWEWALARETTVYTHVSRTSFMRREVFVQDMYSAPGQKSKFLSASIHLISLDIIKPSFFKVGF